MTLVNTTIRMDYPSVSDTDPLPYTFKVFSASDLKVYKDDVLLTLTTDYTVSGAGTDAGGTVTLTAAPSPAAAIAILASIVNTQTTDLVNETSFFQDRIEDRFDKLCRADQMAAERSARQLALPSSEPPPLIGGYPLLTELPSLADRAGKVLGFEAVTGRPVAYSTTDPYFQFYGNDDWGLITSDFNSEYDYGSIT